MLHSAGKPNAAETFHARTHRKYPTVFGAILKGPISAETSTVVRLNASEFRRRPVQRCFRRGKVPMPRLILRSGQRHIEPDFDNFVVLSQNRFRDCRNKRMGRQFHKAANSLRMNLDIIAVRAAPHRRAGLLQCFGKRTSMSSPTLSPTQEQRRLSFQETRLHTDRPYCRCFQRVKFLLHTHSLSSSAPPFLRGSRSQFVPCSLIRSVPKIIRAAHFWEEMPQVSC